ncbi:MAG TPA: RNA 2',3'-cyclic phosphodiesterase [Myxococcaceae bacterium]|jgi:2'-5' RNA ligase
MRLFTAVTLGGAVEAKATAGIERLRALSPRARWVNPHGVHLTLVFLGEVDAARLPELEEVLTRASGHHAPFTLTIEGGGYFGSPRHPHVLWADVKGDTAALGALQAEVATVLEPLGFPKEKRMYTAHLTLARSKDPKGDPSFAECKKALEGEHWGEARVEHLILFESKGGRYEKRLELPLTGGA